MKTAMMVAIGLNVGTTQTIGTRNQDLICTIDDPLEQVYDFFDDDISSVRNSKYRKLFW